MKTQPTNPQAPRKDNDAKGNQQKDQPRNTDAERKPGQTTQRGNK